MPRPPHATSDPNAALPSASRPALERHEANALGHYAGEAYGPLNDGLRGGSVPAAQQATHEALQAAFTKAPVMTEAVAVTRGINFKSSKEVAAFAAQIEQAAANGGVVRLPGYTSTTTDPAGAKGFADAPVQVHIAAVHGLDVRPFSGNPEENELLLNHNAQFRVVKVEKVGGKVAVHLAQLPPDRHHPEAVGVGEKRKSLWKRLLGG